MRESPVLLRARARRGGEGRGGRRARAGRARGRGLSLAPPRRQQVRGKQRRVVGRGRPGHVTRARQGAGRGGAARALRRCFTVLLRSPLRGGRSPRGRERRWARCVQRGARPKRWGGRAWCRSRPRPAVGRGPVVRQAKRRAGWGEIPRSAPPRVSLPPSVPPSLRQFLAAPASPLASAVLASLRPGRRCPGSGGAGLPVSAVAPRKGSSGHRCPASPRFRQRQGRPRPPPGLSEAGERRGAVWGHGGRGAGGAREPALERGAAWAAGEEAGRGAGERRLCGKQPRAAAAPAGGAPLSGAAGWRARPMAARRAAGLGGVLSGELGSPAAGSLLRTTPDPASSSVCSGSDSRVKSLGICLRALMKGFSP